MRRLLSLLCLFLPLAAAPGCITHSMACAMGVRIEPGWDPPVLTSALWAITTIALTTDEEDELFHHEDEDDDFVDELEEDLTMVGFAILATPVTLAADGLLVNIDRGVDAGPWDWIGAAVLFPFTAVLDVATSPVQLFFWGEDMFACEGRDEPQIELDLQPGIHRSQPDR